MSEKRSLNPLLLLVGLVAGAAGALMVSDVKTRKKATVALEKAKKHGTNTAESLLEKIKKAASDAEVLVGQKGLDNKAKKKIAKPKK